MGKQKDIRDFIERKITGGEYSPGAKLPAEMELCRQFGAARATVAHALRALQDSGLISRRRGAGTFVNPRDKAGRTKRVGLLISGIGDTEIFDPICSSIASHAAQFDFHLLWNQIPANCPAEKKSAATIAVCRQYIREKVQGIFFEPLELADDKDNTNTSIVRLLQDAGIAVVLIDSDLSFPERSPLDLAGVDNFRAGYVIASHLLDRKCVSPVFVHRPRSASTTQARAAGFCAALAARGIAVEGRVIEAEPDSRLAARLTAGKRIDGIVCGNDYTAAVLMQNLLAAGARIPGQIKITGMDNVKYAHLLGIPLTTLAQPCRDIGLAALELMRFRLDNPGAPARQILPDFQLIARESTR